MINNKTKMGEAYTFEELNTRLERVNSWINNCDQKAGILLAFAGTFVTLFLTSDIISKGHEILIDPFINHWFKGESNSFSIVNTVIIIALGIAVYNLIFAVRSLLLVLNPKTNIEDFDNGNESQIEKNSLLHFQTIANMKVYDDFAKQCKNQTDDQYLNDLLSQIFCNSIICNDKFANYKDGLTHFTYMLICCGLIVLVVFFFM